MEFLQVLKHELNYHWCNEINTVNYDTNMTCTFRSFDRNGSNYIELGEFIVGALFICEMFTVEECVLVFNAFIKADHRRISLDEFRANMRIEMDAKKYIKIHNWFEAILGCKSITPFRISDALMRPPFSFITAPERGVFSEAKDEKRCKKNNGYSGLIGIDNFIKYFMETDNAMQLL